MNNGTAARLQVESVWGTPQPRPAWLGGGFGTVYSAPYRTPEKIVPRPSYAETEADRIIQECKSFAEFDVDRLRTLIIELIEEWE